MDRVCVLMASYNGEKFIREQIDSILRQEGVEVSLVVRDDHSTDSTPEILREYEEAGKISVLRDDIHLGAPNGFMKLLYEADPCDYYAFADQDDIWLPDKLSRAVNAIRGFNGPALYWLYYSAGKPAHAIIPETIPGTISPDAACAWDSGR